MATLRLSLNNDFLQINDPKSWFNYIYGMDRRSNGDVEDDLSAFGELDYVMELIQQAFDAQLEN